MVSFLPDSMKYRQLVSKATADDEVPAPGFVQEELKRLTFEPEVCTTLEDQLIARLEKKSSNVKLKTLRLMKAICESGSPNFKRDMQRRTQAVRDCLHWRGTPHPTMGDVPNQMVREAAQELINAIYDTENLNNRPAPTSSLGLTSSAPAPAPSPAPATASRMTTASSATAQSTAATAAPSGPSKYTGFGSDNTSGAGGKDDSVNKYFSNVPAPTAQGNNTGYGNTAGQTDGLSAKAASAFTAGFSQLKQTVTGVPAKKEGAATGGGPSLYTGADPGPAQGAPVQQQPVGQAVSGLSAAAAAIDPGLDLTPVEREMLAQSMAATAAATAATAPAPTPAPAPVVHEPVRSAAGQYEETVVAQITAPGGVRAAPPKEDLKKIQTQAKSLDLPLLIMLLCSKLETDVWQARLKSLHVIDALLKAPDADVAKQVRKLTSNRMPLLKELEQVQQPALADLAKKVVRFVEEANTADPPAAPKPAQSESSSKDMLDLGVSNTSSLFAGMNIGGVSQPSPGIVPQAPTRETTGGGVPDLMSGMGGPAVAAPNNAALDLDGLFGPAPNQNNPPAPAPAPQPNMMMGTGLMDMQPSDVMGMQQPAPSMGLQQQQYPQGLGMQQQGVDMQQVPMGVSQQMGMTQPMGMNQQMGMQQPMGMNQQMGMNQMMGMQQQPMGMGQQQPMMGMPQQQPMMNVQQQGMGMQQGGAAVPMSGMMNANNQQPPAASSGAQASSFDFINSSNQAQQAKGSLGLGSNQDPFSFANTAMGR